MPALPRCPSDDELQLLAVGKLPDPPAGEFEEHLLTCDNCAQRTVALQPEDPLVLALARGKPAPPDASAGGPDRLEELMDSLSGLFAAQSEDTQLSGPHDTQDVPLDLSQNVIQELSAAWRPAESADELGRIGHYRILKLLGAGGMGAVFLAEDLQLHRQVALKMMRPKAAVASGATERFLREARSAAALRHDHILTIYQVDEERGVPFLAMEYLEGESLEERLKRDPVLPLDQTLRIGREIAEGLAAAYAKGLIHRDIKPGNIWLEAGRDRVKILDFGLARLHQTDAQLTSSGMIVGTPAYMAPEQASGDPIDGRADLFSLGVILYRMTTGKLPFPGCNTLETLKLLATLTPTSPKSLNPAIPAALSDLIDELLSKTPTARPESAQSVDQRLADIEHELQTDLSTAINSAAQMPRRLRAWKPAAALLAGSLLILLAVVVIKIRTNDGKETKVIVKVPGDVQSVATEIQSSPATNGSRGKGAAASTAGWHGWPADAPKPAIAPFNAEQAKRHQDEWAKYLGVPVEYANSVGMKFHLIPPGEFMMGSTQEEIAAALKEMGDPSNPHWPPAIKSEAPRHSVILTKPFYLGAHEVTQGDFETLMGKNPSCFYENSKVEWAAKEFRKIDTTKHPVETVVWKDAAEFCDRLSRREKHHPVYGDAGQAELQGLTLGYRLPTEAEWEFSCRAGTTTRYWTGDGVDELLSAAWCSANSEPRSHAVGQLLPNPFGSYDVHGNVGEWVQDFYDPTFYSKAYGRRAIDPSGAPQSDRRGVRGGDVHQPWRSRSATRGNADPTYEGHYIGFRTALSVEAVKKAIKIPQTTDDLQSRRSSADDGPPITAVQFDGIEDQAVVPSISELPDEEWTMEAWVTPSPGKDSGHIVWLGSPGWTTLQTLSGGFACFAHRNGTERAASGPPATTGQRFHAAAVYRDHTLTLFVDGFPFRQQYKTDQKHWVVKGLLTIAGSSVDKPVADKPMAPFAGTIDQVRVSNFARYDAKFTPPVEFPAGDERDIVCLRFDAGEGTKIRDVSGHERHGELKGGKWVRITKKGQIVASGWHGWPADAPKPAIAPFAAEQAMRHQKEWAVYLKIPVEYTNTIGMKFRLIPPGEFIMGSTAREIEEKLNLVGDDKHWQDCIKSEAPQHKVILTQPTFLGVHEVTQGQYEKVMGMNPSYFAKTGPDPQWVEKVAGIDTTSHPVENVTWNDSAEFCTKLSQQERLKPFYDLAGETIAPLDGTGYRLPSEGEWEFACRAGTTTKYWIGDRDDDLVRVGWLGTNSGWRTHAVGELEPNPFGMYDIHGNIWECVQDGWNATDYGLFQEKPAINPRGPVPAGSQRVARGGDWRSSATGCRSSLRYTFKPMLSFVHLGFRVSLTIDAVRQALKQ